MGLVRDGGLVRSIRFVALIMRMCELRLARILVQIVNATVLGVYFDRPSFGHFFEIRLRRRSRRLFLLPPSKLSMFIAHLDKNYSTASQWRRKITWS